MAADLLDAAALRVDWIRGLGDHLIGAVRLAADPGGRIVWVRYHAREPRSPKVPRPRRRDELPTTPEFAEAVAAASPVGFRPWRIKAVGALVPVRLALAPGARSGPEGSREILSVVARRRVAHRPYSTYLAAAPTAAARAGDAKLVRLLVGDLAKHRVRGWLAEVTNADQYTHICVVLNRDSAVEAACWTKTINRGAAGVMRPHTSWLVLTHSPARSPIVSRTARRTATSLMWPGGAARLRAAAAAALGRHAGTACAFVGGL